MKQPEKHELVPFKTPKDVINHLVLPLPQHNFNNYYSDSDEDVVPNLGYAPQVVVDSDSESDVSV